MGRKYVEFDRALKAGRGKAEKQVLRFAQDAKFFLMHGDWTGGDLMHGDLTGGDLTCGDLTCGDWMHGDLMRDDLMRDEWDL